MKKSEFKEMIKESVKEVLVEEGVLKNIISEVAMAIGQVQTTQQSAPTQQSFVEQANLQRSQKQKNKLDETRKKMLDAIGKDAFGGVDIFEGTTPMKKGPAPNSQATPASALEGVDPSDSGVDISSLMGGADIWKHLLK